MAGAGYFVRLQLGVATLRLSGRFGLPRLVEMWGARRDRISGMTAITVMTAMMMAAAAVQLPAQEMHPSIPCPVMLVSGHVRGNSIELSFRNEGKMPIQQVSLGCTPPMKGEARDAICHTESGLF